MKIERQVWPNRTCRDAVWGQYQAHACELSDLHEGPCASQSVKESLQHREAWENARLATQQAKREENSA